MLPVQEPQKYKEIERRYNALVASKKATDQVGSGAREVQRVLDIEDKHQLKSPYLEVDPVNPSSSNSAVEKVQTSADSTTVDPLSGVADRYKRRARILLRKLSTESELSWNSSGTIQIDGHEVNGAFMANYFPPDFLWCSKIKCSWGRTVLSETTRSKAGTFHS